MLLNKHFRNQCRKKRYETIEEMQTDKEMKTDFGTYFVIYNTNLPHSALGYVTPDEFASSVQGHAPGQMTTSARKGQTRQPGLSG